MADKRWRAVRIDDVFVRQNTLFEVALFDNRGDQQGEIQGIIITRRVSFEVAHFIMDS
jgi:hypothetical protein